MFVCLDPIYSSVQSTGETSFTEMVHISTGEEQEEDHAGIDRQYSLEKTEDVKFSRMERFEDRLQTVKINLFLSRRSSSSLFR